MRVLLDDGLFQDKSLNRFPEEKICSILLTRFNIRLEGAREKAKLVSDSSFIKWCIARSEIFLQRCLPSVLGQTVKPDAWFLFFDEDYLDYVKPVLSRISAHEWIIPVIPSNPIKSLRHLCLTTCTHYLHTKSVDCDWVATSRLDNDDSLGFGYIQGVKEYSASILSAREPLPGWISFSRGCQLSGDHLFDYPMPNNPFLTLLESKSSFNKGEAKTALFGNHGHVFRSDLPVYLPQARYPMWLQYIHDGNVSNKLNSSLLEYNNPKEILARYFRLR